MTHAMTPLRQRMTEDMDMRKMPHNTKRAYIGNVAAFAQFFGKSPEQLGREQIRTYFITPCAREKSLRQYLPPNPIVHPIPLPKDAGQ